MDSTNVTPILTDEYLLTVRFKFNAMDAPAAREQAHAVLDTHGLRVFNDKGELIHDVKLQRVFPNKPPENIKL